jgi:NADH-quinone oxidoreductase subunit J
MQGKDLFLLIVAGLTLPLSLLLLRTRRLVHAAYLFFALLLLAALLFFLAGGDFPAIAQLLVYVGGILILLLFGIMLTGQREEGQPASTIGQAAGALLLLLALAGPLAAMIQALPAGLPPPRAQLSAEIGILLLTDYLPALELLGILLLVALVGAAWVARRDQ